MAASAITSSDMINPLASQADLGVNAAENYNQIKEVDLSTHASQVSP